VKRRIVSILMLGVLAGLVPGVAHAGQPVGGCSTAFSLTKTTKNTAPLDKNGDGWVCQKDIPAQPPGSVNVQDNNHTL